MYIFRVLKGIPIRPHFGISLSNAKESLLQACEPNSTILLVNTSNDPDAALNEARFDIRIELDEFEKDLQFLKYATSDDVYNIESFIESLQVYHPVSREKFRDEVIALGESKRLQLNQLFMSSRF